MFSCKHQLFPAISKVAWAAATALVFMRHAPTKVKLSIQKNEVIRDGEDKLLSLPVSQDAARRMAQNAYEEQDVVLEV